MELKPVDVRDLRIGMYVAELDRPWVGSPFLFQGFRIESEEDLRKLQASCRYVKIDPERGYDGPAMKQSDTPPPRPIVHEVKPKAASSPELQPHEPDFRKALTQVYQYRERASSFMDNVVKSIREGKRPDASSATHVVKGLTHAVQLNLNASMWLNSLKRRHEHSASHCTNVAVVSLAFAHHLGYEGQDLIDIGVGALLHDVGLMRLPVHLLDKPGKLTDEEEKELREHATEGERLMQRSGKLSPMVLNIIRCHHERINGQGYPQGLSGEQIPQEAMIVALADVYDAMTTERPYRIASSPHNSMNVLKQLATTDFKPKLVQDFMSCIGIYPIGSVVQLNNGSVALVVGHTRKSRIRPEVMLLKNGKGQTYRDWPLLDIDKRSELRDGEQWQIMRVVDPAKFKIDVARVTEAYVDRLYSGTTQRA
jgi:HD-GYP domain-containing protein (c-di-GMP phosphodiesterase class II)